MLVNSMVQLEKDITFAEKHCQEKGGRFTAKRKVVLLALLQLKKATSAYELADYCEAQLNEKITTMSVYRILDFLQEMGLAHKLSLTNKYVACSHIECGHKNELVQFLICDQCQHVEEISMDSSAIKNLQTVVTNKGFHLSTPQLEINGICAECFSNEANDSKAKQ